MIRHIASASVGSIVPQFAGILAAAQARLQNELAARLRASGSVVVTMPTASAAAKILAQVQAMVRGPSVRFNLTAQAALIASLRAQISLYARLILALGAAGVDVYEYDGTAAAFGGEVAGETARGLPGGLPSDHMNALVLATRIPATWAALLEVLIG